MTGVAWFLAFICMAGRHLSSASSPPRPALVAPVGGNVSLTCNLTSGSGITWFLLRSDRPLPLLTVRPSRLGDVTVNLHGADRGRFSSTGHPEGGAVRLEVRGLLEEDAGLYFCTGRCEESVCVGGGVHLVVGGDGGAARRPCWSPEICALPAALVLGLAAIAGLCLHSGQAAACCCRRRVRGQKVTEEDSLHYSSLRHGGKPRPFCRGATGLVEVDVTYSTVTTRKNPNA
ncbi:uncharacterized protein LOC119219027 [Pungitius pungitius]|uniref:uncharacterized protein LOC119219027 n=1 Tax=Pungitius pungitius TaxID=134920 RepID=UPI002E1131E0